METRKDPLTGILFTPRRSNQCYSSRQTQTKFNNNKAKQSRLALKSIMNPLLNNFKILNTIMKKDSQIFHKQFLLGKGFNFGLHTHYVKFENESRSVIFKFIIIGEGENVRIVKHA